MLHDDYLSCGQYENQPKHSTTKGFSVFVDVKTGKHHFALVDNGGKVLLRSEGYETEKARETGVQSVITNLPNAKRYHVVAEGKQFFVTLKAANHREIGRSCPFATEAEAKAVVTRLSGKNPFDAPVVKVAAPKVAKAPVAKVAAPKVAKAPVAKVAAPKVAKAPVAKVVAPKVEKAPVAKVVAPKVAKAPVAKVVAPKVEKAPVAKVVAPKVAKAPVAKVATPKVTKQTAEYGTCGFYLGHETLTFGQIQTGYTKFVGADGSFYFAVYNPDGTVYLGSVGYALAEMRDQAFVAVVHSIENPDCYSVIENGNAFYSVLSDVNGKELARSCAYGSFTEAFKVTPNGRVRAEVSLY